MKNIFLFILSFIGFTYVLYFIKNCIIIPIILFYEIKNLDGKSDWCFSIEKSFNIKNLPKDFIYWSKGVFLKCNIKLFKKVKNYPEDSNGYYIILSDKQLNFFKTSKLFFYYTKSIKLFNFYVNDETNKVSFDENKKLLSFNMYLTLLIFYFYCLLFYKDLEILKNEME